MISTEEAEVVGTVWSKGNPICRRRAGERSLEARETRLEWFAIQACSFKITSWFNGHHLCRTECTSAVGPTRGSRLPQHRRCEEDSLQKEEEHTTPVPNH